MDGATDAAMAARMAAGVEASRRHDAALAITCFEAAAALQPTAAAPYLLMAAEWAQSGQVDAAEQAYARALERQPDLHIARFQCGLLQVVTGRIDAGVRTWAPLQSLPDDHPLPHFVAGLQACLQGDGGVARRRLEAGLSCGTDNEPLAADMRALIERLRAAAALEASVPGCLPPDAGPAAMAAGEPAAATAAQHVLLAGYAAASGPVR